MKSEELKIGDRMESQQKSEEFIFFVYYEEYSDSGRICHKIGRIDKELS